MSLTIADLARNDLNGARAYYEARGRKLSREEFRILRSLQDRPTQFDLMTEGWVVEGEPPMIAQLLENHHP